MNWQPIETAPRDGRPVLLWYKDFVAEGPVVGEWLPSSRKAFDGWWNTGGPATDDSDFTHWCEIVPPSS